jgi:threonine synthase
MLYKSTRNDDILYDFKTIFYKGLADDGGLFIPNKIPELTSDELYKFKKYTFQELCFNIFRKYVSLHSIPDNDLYEIIKNSFSEFKHPEITPVKNLNDFYILELFYGPTYSFKDIALQFMGNLYNYFLEKDNLKINIICATSGDTGSAAIYALKNKKNINCIVLHPHDKISNIQKKQMVTINDKNIHNIAVKGTFDDCQKIVKDILKNKENISTINSINWCRILIQISYYFYAYYTINATTNRDFVNFSVPTGNFGDILAGYYAKKMGLPIDKLIIATNENDILCRFYKTGVYEPKKCIETLTPAMDITISSNFERLLYYIIGNTSNIMESLSKKNKFELTDFELDKIKSDFVCESIKDIEIETTLKFVYNKYKYLCDPHTTVGIASYIKLKFHETKKTICLATAHPGKFPDSIVKCIPEKDDDFIPLNLILLFNKKEHYKILEKDNVERHILKLLYDSDNS